MTTTKMTAIIEKVQQHVAMGTDEIQDFVNADWPEGDEHTRWLETANVDEIADWVIAGRNE